MSRKTTIQIQAHLGDDAHTVRNIWIETFGDDDVDVMLSMHDGRTYTLNRAELDRINAEVASHDRLLAEAKKEAA